MDCDKYKIKREIKILTQNTCYTTLSVGNSKHTIPTRELGEWLKYFEEVKMYKNCCKPTNETILYDEEKHKYYFVCNKCFYFIRWLEDYE